MQIWLYFDTTGITQQQWEPVWNECNDVLQYFPVPLTYSALVNKWGTERLERKTDLIHEDGDQTYLCVNSDIATLIVGDSFELYKNINMFPSTQYIDEPSDKDILWLDEDDIDDYRGRCRIWENGTRGAPYGLAMIAVGILLENRFPYNCFMFGFSYTDQHVEYMSSWLAGVLKTKINLPICNDPERLWERIVPLYPNIELAIRRFCRLAQTDPKQCYDLVIKYGYGDALQNELIRSLSRYSSISQWGSIDLLFPFIEATQDIELVAKMIKRIDDNYDNKNFSLESLLSLIIRHGATINPIHSEIVKEWNDRGDGLTTTFGELNMLILKMKGMPQKIDFYASPDKLIEIFGCMEPENGTEFVNIIEEETKKCIEKYKKLEDATEKIVEQSSMTDSFAYSDSSKIMARWTRRRYLPYEDYILSQVEEQIERFNNSVESSLSIAKDLGQLVKEYDETNDKPFRLNSRKKTVTELSRLSKERNFAIRETTWEIIDNEKDIDILTMLRAYLSINDREVGFWAWRKHIFETPSLWNAMRDAFLKE